MITEQLIEGLDLPDYHNWLEDIWVYDFWWDYLLDETTKEWADIGIDLHGYRQSPKPNISFDIHQRQCASDGWVRNDGMFYEAYQDQLMAVSPVYAQMFFEGYILVKWSTSRNGWLQVDISDDTYGDEVFTSGLFAGTSVRAMLECESVTFEEFEKCITEIIQELHDELLSKLTSTYEYDTSEERYKEWIMEQINEAV
jgi:hypothetical protein